MEPLRLLIAFEGIDGAGKWTQMHKVRDWLSELTNYEVPFSSEPSDDTDSGTPLGKTIRKMLKGELPRPEDPFEFQRIYVLNRAELNVCFMRPRFEERARLGIPCVYLKERYALSTVAYGMLSGRSPEDLIQLHEDVVGSHMMWPDLTILLDLSAEEAIRRIAKGRDHSEFFEKEKTLEKVRENYLRARFIGPFRGKVAVVDGDQSENVVFEAVKKTIRPLLGNHPHTG